MARMDMDPTVGTHAGVDWGSILAAVVSGIGVTMLVFSLGAAIGVSADTFGGAGGGEEEAGIALGTWSVISALVGSFVGSLVGGIMSPVRSFGWSLMHGVTAWGVSLLGVALLAFLGAAGTLATALGSNAFVVENGNLTTSDAVAWGGWALVGGLALSLIVSVLGWWTGAQVEPGYEEVTTTSATPSGGIPVA